MNHYFNDKKQLMVEYFFDDKYYKLTNDAVFHGVIEAALKVWDTFEDKPPIVIKEIARLKLLGNYSSVASDVVMQFSDENKIKLLLHATGEAKEWLEYFLFGLSIIPNVSGRYIIKDMNARMLNINSLLKDLQIIINKFSV